MSFINSISLITAFFGGMVALFAPCCITFLLPSYLANIFREKKRVIWMTLIFGLGIATILVPAALGIRAIGIFFTKYHTQTYIVGGIFMMMLGVMQVTGKKITLPMLNLTIDLNTRHDPWSIYLLGVFSGITSSCCTPVLAGVLTISFLSPSLLWAGLAGLSYVFGMVLPLVVLSLLLENVNWTHLPKLRGKTVAIGKRHILLTDAIAGVLYMLVGLTFSVLAITGNIAMGSEQVLEQTFSPSLLSFVRFLRSIPGSDGIGAIIIIISLIFLIKKGKKHL
ncbi:MAG: cytochrome c biogenesis protein CcdA [bacterium]|nr:cytochrome c biogenesis protein CcdA [bacterium]